MTLPKGPVINILDEVAKLKKILELPITNIVFDKIHQYGTLYVNSEGLSG